jgi:hypothetical protein
MTKMLIGIVILGGVTGIVLWRTGWQPWNDDARSGSSGSTLPTELPYARLDLSPGADHECVQVPGEEEYACTGEFEFPSTGFHIYEQTDSFNGYGFKIWINGSGDVAPDGYAADDSTAGPFWIFEDALSLPPPPWADPESPGRTIEVLAEWTRDGITYQSTDNYITFP